MSARRGNVRRLPNLIRAEPFYATLAYMTTPIVALTESAELIYDMYKSKPLPERYPQIPGMSTDDFFGTRVAEIVLTELSMIDQFKHAVDTLSTEPDLDIFRAAENELQPIISHPYGSSRGPFSTVVSSLFISAAQRIYYLRMEVSKPSFVRAVIENFEEMLRAARGEPVRSYSVVGYSGILLEGSAQIQTPWGTLRPAPPDIAARLPMTRQSPFTASAVLSTPQLISLRVSQEANPEPILPDPQSLAYAEQARQLVPLAFALATIEGEWCAPMVVFETSLLPIGGGNWFSLPGMFLPPRPPVAPSATQLAEAADWSRRLAQDRDDSLQVAERRIVSAIGQRSDKADSLIDAVIAWESIVGTRAETLYRVTAALAKLLEPEPSRRAEFRKDLQRIYDTRSRVVHGDLVEQADIAAAADQAIRIALRTLRELYARTPDWRTGKSNARSDRIILES